MIKIKKNNYFYKNRKILGAGVLFFLTCFIILTIAINTKADDNIIDFTLPEGTETVDILIHTDIDYNGNKQPLSNVGIKMATALHRNYTTKQCEYYKTDDGINELEESYLSRKKRYEDEYKDDRYVNYLKNKYYEYYSDENNGAGHQAADEYLKKQLTDNYELKTEEDFLAENSNYKDEYLKYLEKEYSGTYRLFMKRYTLEDYCEDYKDEDFNSSDYDEKDEYLAYLEEQYGTEYQKFKEEYTIEKYCEDYEDEDFDSYVKEKYDDYYNELFIKYMDDKYPKSFKDYMSEKYSYISYFDNFEDYYQNEYSSRCNEPEYDYDNICHYDGSDKSGCIYSIPLLHFDKYLNFKGTDNGYQIESLSYTEISSTQVKTDKNGNLRLSNIPEGKYIIYESELSGNGLTFLGPIRIIVKKVDGILKVYFANSNFGRHIQVTKEDDDNIKINIVHQQKNTTNNSELPYQSCYTVSGGTIFTGSKTGLKIEKEMYPPSNKDWEVNLKVFADGSGWGTLTNAYNSEYIYSIVDYIYNKYNYNYGKYLSEYRNDYYNEYLLYLDETYKEKYESSDYYIKNYDTLQKFAEYAYGESYGNYLIYKFNENDKYHNEYLGYLSNKYDAEFKKIKNYTVEEYCANRYCESYDDYLLDRYYSSDDYYDKYLQYIKEEYSDDYNSYMEGYTLEKYASEKHRESYYNEDRGFYPEIYDALYESTHAEYLGLLEKQYGEEYKNYTDKYESIEEYCEKVYNITYDYNFHRYYLNNYSFFHPLYLEYLEENYGDEYRKYKEEYTLEKYCEEKYYNLYESFLRSNYDEYYYEYNYKYFDEFKDEYNQYLDSERKEYVDNLTLEEYVENKYNDTYYNYLKNKFFYNDFLNYLEEKYGKEYKEYYDKISSENDKYEHIVLSKKNGNVTEFSNTREWEYCSYYGELGDNLYIDIIEESNDYDVKFSSNVNGLKQEGNRYYGTVENSSGHEISVKVNNWDKNYGDLEISKKVFGVDEEEKANREFKFTVTLIAPLAKNLSDSYLYTKNGEEKLESLTLTDGDNSDTKIATITLRDGESMRIIGLPAGTKYKVEEVQENGYQVSVKNNEGIVPSADLADVLFTNTKAKTGLLTVTKKVVDSNKEKNKTRDKEFTFTVTLSDKNINGKYGEMEFKDGVATFTLKDGESKTAINIPEGIKYEVTEKAVNGYDVTKDGDKGTIEEGVEKKVLFTNTKTILSPNTSDGILIALFVVLISLGALIYFQVNKKYLM